MKKLLTLLALIICIGARAQVPVDSTDLRTKINQWIVQNNHRQISGLQLNQILNGIANQLKGYGYTNVTRVTGGALDTLIFTNPYGITTKILEVPLANLTPGIDDILKRQQALTADRQIGANFHFVTIDSSTGLRVYRRTVTQATYNEGLIMENKTPVNGGNIAEYSPGITQIGHYFRTTDQNYAWHSYVQTSAQGMSFKGDYVWESSLTGGAFSEFMRMGSNSRILTVAGGISSPSIQAGTGGIGGATLSITGLVILTEIEMPTSGVITSPITIITGANVTATLADAIGSSSRQYTILNAQATTANIITTTGTSLFYDGVIGDGIGQTVYQLQKGKSITVVSASPINRYYIISNN